MQTILGLKKEFIDSGWWDIDERISSDGWGNGKSGTQSGFGVLTGTEKLPFH